MCRMWNRMCSRARRYSVNLGGTGIITYFWWNRLKNSGGSIPPPPSHPLWFQRPCVCSSRSNHAFNPSNSRFFDRIILLFQRNPAILCITMGWTYFCLALKPCQTKRANLCWDAPKMRLQRKNQVHRLLKTKWLSNKKLGASQKDIWPFLFC